VQSEKLAALLAYVQADGRICPQPQRWNELWEMLPDRKQKPSGGWSPPPPLILAAWWHTTGLEKMLRLREHIEYAASNGLLGKLQR
jgi:hypothetical protein